jgi:hypothetical protein
MPSSTICRTLITLGYVLAIALAGRPARGTALAALGLVAVWLAPLLLSHSRHAVTQPAAVPAAAVIRPGEAV